MKFLLSLLSTIAAALSVATTSPAQQASPADRLASFWRQRRAQLVTVLQTRQALNDSALPGTTATAAPQQALAATNSLDAQSRTYHDGRHVSRVCPADEAFRSHGEYLHYWDGQDTLTSRNRFTIRLDRGYSEAGLADPWPDVLVGMIDGLPVVPMLEHAVSHGRAETVPIDNDEWDITFPVLEDAVETYGRHLRVRFSARRGGTIERCELGHGSVTFLAVEFDRWDGSSTAGCCWPRQVTYTRTVLRRGVSPAVPLLQQDFVQNRVTCSLEWRDRDGAAPAELKDRLDNATFVDFDDRALCVRSDRLDAVIAQTALAWSSRTATARPDAGKTAVSCEHRPSEGMGAWWTVASVRSQMMSDSRVVDYESLASARCTQAALAMYAALQGNPTSLSELVAARADNVLDLEAGIELAADHGMRLVPCTVPDGPPRISGPFLLTLGPDSAAAVRHMAVAQWDAERIRVWALGAPAWLATPEELRSLNPAATYVVSETDAVRLFADGGRYWLLGLIAGLLAIGTAGFYWGAKTRRSAARGVLATGLSLFLFMAACKDSVYAIASLPDEVALGDLDYGETSEFRVQLANHGSKTIHIYDIKTTCGCLRVECGSRSVSAHQRIGLLGRLTATSLGAITQRAQIETSAGKAVLSVRATGKPCVRVTPRVVSCRLIGEEAGATLCRIHVRLPKNAVVTDVTAAVLAGGSEMKVSATQPERREFGEVVEVQYDCRLPATTLPKGEFLGNFRCAVTTSATVAPLEVSKLIHLTSRPEGD